MAAAVVATMLSCVGPRTSLLTCTLLTLGCGVRDPAPYYDYASRGVSRVRLHLEAEGVAVAAAQVQLTAYAGELEPDTSGASSPELLWQGQSNLRGELDVQVYPQRTRRWLRVVVLAPGLRGPVAGLDEAMRTASTPSALIEVPLDAAHDLYISLRPSEVPLDPAGALFTDGWALAGLQLDPRLDNTLEVLAQTQVSVENLRPVAASHGALGYFVRRKTEPEVVVHRGIVAQQALAIGEPGWLLDPQGQPRTFMPGELLDFFIVPEGWKNGQVRGWNDAQPVLPFGEPVGNLIANVASTRPALNPEVACASLGRARRSVGAQIHDPKGPPRLVMGFEASSRVGASDDDFDDLLFAIDSSTPKALDAQETFDFDPAEPDPDHDGVLGLQDAFPNDGARSFMVRIPAQGRGVLALEDGNPDYGPSDFNDAVVHYAYDLVLNAQGEVVELVGTFFSVAQGSNVAYGLSLGLPQLPTDVEGTVGLERLRPDGSHEAASLFTIEQLRDRNAHVVVQDILLAEPAGSTPGASNTKAPTWTMPLRSARVRFTFDDPVPMQTLAANAFDPFFVAEGVQTHLPGRGASSGLDAEGRPQMLDVPGTWAHPAEDVRIEDAYPDFELWQVDGGFRHEDWYERPSERPGQVVMALDLDRTQRPWIQWPGGL